MPSSSDSSRTESPDERNERDERDGSVVSRRQALVTLGTVGAGLAVYGTQVYVPRNQRRTRPTRSGSRTGPWSRGSREAVAIVRDQTDV